MSKLTRLLVSDTLFRFVSAQTKTASVPTTIESNCSHNDYANLFSQRVNQFVHTTIESHFSYIEKAKRTLNPKAFVLGDEWVCGSVADALRVVRKRASWELTSKRAINGTHSQKETLNPKP